MITLIKSNPAYHFKAQNLHPDSHEFFPASQAAQTAGCVHKHLPGICEHGEVSGLAAALFRKLLVLSNKHP